MNTSAPLALLEAEPGSRYRVRVLRAGLSHNNVFYSDAALMKGAPLFDGVRVFAKSDKEHLAGEGKDIRNLVGWITNPAFTAGAGPDAGELLADLVFLDPQGDIARKVKAAWDGGMTSLFGLSIDALGKVRKERRGTSPVTVLDTFEKVRSVDLIVEPGAGGAVVALTEAASLPDGEQAGSSVDVVKAVMGSNLPDPAKERVLGQFQGRTASSAEIQEALKGEAAYVRSLGLGWQPSSGVGSMRIDLIESRADKVTKMLDALFDPKDRSVRSLRECYVEITGDKDITGHPGRCDRARLTEALDSASFPDVLGNAIQRRMVAEYQGQNQFDVWRQIATTVPVSDFRPQHRVRFGGYGDLPGVAENDPYPNVTSPTDEEAVYSVGKRGGIETLTIEMVANDDVGAVQRIPVRLARSAKRTLCKFVLDLMASNPAIYDGTALFHADHGNLGSAALDGASVAAGRLAMKGQKEKDSGERLGIGPRYLWVPDEMEEAAVNLFRRNTEQDKTFLQSLSLEVIPVWYWTDANNWFLSADPADIPSVEIGFWQGGEDPELFVADNPRAGTLFTNDQIQYKIRHVYGGAVVDYRGLYASMPA